MKDGMDYKAELKYLEESGILDKPNPRCGCGFRKSEHVMGNGCPQQATEFHEQPKAEVRTIPRINGTAKEKIEWLLENIHRISKTAFNFDTGEVEILIGDDISVFLSPDGNWWIEQSGK